MNRRALDALRNFCAATQSPSRVDTGVIHSVASELLLIPALYNVVQYELKHLGIQADTLGVCRWLYIRGATVLKVLCQYPAPSIEICPDDGEEESKWQEVRIYTTILKYRI